MLFRARVMKASSSPIYSPAARVVEYEIKRFNTGFLNEPQTVFQGPPTDAMDTAWLDLVSYLLPEEARQLIDPTVLVPGTNVYIGELDVFHQLRCLDMIRMSAYPHRYNSSGKGIYHGDPIMPMNREVQLRHCVNSVRQSLMCSADVSVNTFYNLEDGHPFHRSPKLEFLATTPSLNLNARRRCPVTTMFKTIRRCFAEPASTQSIELVEHGFDALPPDADHEDTRWREPIDRSEATILSPMFYLAGILFLLVTSIAMTQALLTHAPVPEVFRELLYTPAESLLEYEQIRFHTGFLDEEQLSAFDGPSTVIMDQAWSDLYDTQKYAIVALIEEENNRLADPTIPFLGNRSQLYGGLDVFHQLHCLDYVRHHLEPERYKTNHHHHHMRSVPRPSRPTKNIPNGVTYFPEDEHVAHCIDILRQSVMCSADISVVSWFLDVDEGSKKHKDARPNLRSRFNQKRMCRNFEKLREWSGSRAPGVVATGGSDSRTTSMSTMNYPIQSMSVAQEGEKIIPIEYVSPGPKHRKWSMTLVKRRVLRRYAHTGSAIPSPATPVFGLMVFDSMRSSNDVNYLQVNDAFNTLLATVPSPSELTLITMKLAVCLVALSTLAAMVSSTTCEDSGAVDRMLPLAYPVGV
ncbi:hypothetical protein ONZ45_g13003 [Pleurotus djamor]|nr:hypothetical protein ONZ45_g13003 [Pleurotus djamor]